MKKNNAFRRAAALMAALSITVSLAAPAFAGTYYIDNGDITVTKNADGSQTVEQNGTSNNDSDEIIITTTGAAITTLESDLEGPAAEDSDFGPVVEDNYQPAQPESTEESEDADQPEGTDQPEDAEEPKAADRKESTEEPEDADRKESADQQPQPQQAAPADAAPAAPAPANGFCKNIITVINNAATALKLTLKDVKIDVSDTGDQYDWDQKGKAALSVQGKGNVEIELDGDNELKSGTQSAGLEKNSTGTLTLKDDNKEAGSLTATGGFNSAGIGGGYLGDGKNITITGGTVTATGGSSGAGIGGGREGKGENITITGGTVNATGNEDGAGIGGGSSGSGENITINGGEVTASGGDNWDDCGAGIGGGNGGVGKNITITGGTVNATGGYGGGAAGIGGAFANGENITITGGTVNAAGSYFDHGMGAGIGGGGNSSGNNITITGGTVTATGGDNGGAGIGGGAEGGGGNNITIKGGTVTATGGGYRGNSGAGIGGGSGGSGENITINDGKVTATGGNSGAGIGGGSGGFWSGESGSGKNITINGGTVNATGTDGGAGIGGGENGNGEDITINGGKVNASGAYGGAGIGGGLNGIGSKVTVSGAAQVTATATGSGPDWSGVGTGATIGNGGSKTPDGPVDGKEIQADISHLTTGYIHHIIYNPDLDSDGKPDGILKEWWEFALPKPIPDGESLDLHVETLKGAPLLFNTRQQGSTLRVTTDNLSARLHGTRQALETLQEQGVEQIQFVTTLKTTTLSVEDLLTEGGSWFALEHDGLGSRRLSAAQAESLKCQMR